MLIRREDFGNIEELTKGSHRKVLMKCDNCGVELSIVWKNYIRKKSNKDLCKLCSMRTDGYRKKQGKKSKERWLDEKYKENMTNIFKERWKNEEYKKNHSDMMIERWKNEEYKKNHSDMMTERWKNEEYKKNHSDIMIERWSDEEYKENMTNIFKERWNNEEYKKNYSDMMTERWKNEEYKKNHIQKMKNKFNHSYEYVEKQIRKKGYELLSKEYINANIKLKVKCPKGHVFKIRYGDLQQGIGCPSCPSLQSKTEKQIAEYIKSLNVDIIENDRSIIYPYELDIVIPSHKLAIEYCGLYWHSEKYKDKNYHKDKLEKTNKAGYRLLTIFEDEWFNKKEIVKNRLKHILSLNTERIYARKCEIKEITTKEAREFINKYHIQGYSNSKVKLGAFYKDELISVNTFIKRGLVYELNRFCMNKNVIGIASKLLKYFQKNYEWEEIYTFADRRWSDGKLYETIGFEKDKELNPDYSYTKNFLNRYHKFGFRHVGMKNKLENYDPNLSEHDNMLNNGWNRIWDCGKIRYKISKLIAED